MLYVNYTCIKKKKTKEAETLLGGAQTVYKIVIFTRDLEKSNTTLGYSPW